MNLTRRQFVGRALAAGIGLAAATGGYAWLLEPRWVGVTRHTLRLPGLPPAWAGLKLVHLTDLHRGRYISAEYLARCVARANALQPDLMLFTGDYLSTGHGKKGWAMYGRAHTPAELVHDCAQVIGQARARHGVFACLGNHDHWFNADVVTRELEGVGVGVLRNASIRVTINGTALPIVGLGDLWTEGVNTARAFAGVAAPVTLVLMHNPDTFAGWRRPGTHLVLAGHTHGGQVSLPLFGPPLVPSRYGARYAHGLFREQDSWMYVNRGVGMIFPPVRFNCPPEIALLELQPA